MSKFQLSVTVDIPDDFTKGTIDAARLDEMMRLIRETGATRVHWLYYGEIDPADERAGNIWDCYWASHGRATIAAIGEPLRAAVRAAKAHGLEIYGVLKPYNGGLAGSLPAGSPEAGTRSQLTRIGGSLVQVIPFLEKHPEMRPQRRPGLASTGPIRAIHLAKAEASPTRLRPEHLRLWVSADNHAYRPLPLTPTGSVEVAPAAREVRDYHGNILTRAGDPVQVLRLTGLEIHEPFVVVTTTHATGPGDFRNTPLGMVSVFGDAGEPLDCVLATHAALWIKPRDFRTYGLEFDQGYGHLPITLDAPWAAPTGDKWTHFSGEDEFADEAIFGHGQAGGFIGIARGKNTHLSATPCEAYPEVRTLWLGWVQAMLDAGVDGVDLRISAHGSLTDEPETFGWNPPVLAAYRARFGEGEVEPGKLARVRGEFYTGFVRDAAALVRKHGRRTQLHLHAEAFRPDRVFGQVHGIPANVEFQWPRWLDEGLADEVVLRTSWFEAAEDPLGAAQTNRSRLSSALMDPVATAMLEAAARHRLPVTLNRYIGRAAKLAEYLDDLSLTARDGRFARFDVYEFFDLAQASPDHPGLTPRAGRLAALQQRWAGLNSPPSLP
ncbi:MAG: hypothetical protein ACO3DQ_01135 [Cephaloticoccus sp.]